VDGLQPAAGGSGPDAPDGAGVTTHVVGGHRVVIVGGGFGGLYAAKHLRRAPVGVTLIDRHNYHLFQPLLYQAATGGLSPANIAAPLRSILQAAKNTTVLLGEVTDIDPGRRVVATDTQEVPYDSLIVAAGMVNSYFGHDAWEADAPGLKTLADATEIRRRVLGAFENAERETHWPHIPAWLTFVVVGGGATGVELAGAVAEISRDTLRRDFRRIRSADAKIILVEGGSRLLDAFEPDLAESARHTLQRLGVEVWLESRVTDIAPGHVVVRRDGGERTLQTHTVLWAAGVKASPLGALLARRTGCALDRAGRVEVLHDCTVPGHPEIFVIGDLAHFERDGALLPGVAQVAMQQGKYVTELIVRRLKGEDDAPEFHYVDLGSMATIGRAAAVCQIGKAHLTGLLGWLTWLFVHLMYIVQHENKVLVLFQWAMGYFTRNRAARLITDPAWQPATPPADGESK
jgi:NADH dehydrogenase